VIQASQPETDRVTIAMDDLDAMQRHKLLRDLPLYCFAAVQRPIPKHRDTERFINFFRVGKSKKDVEAMNTIVDILLDSEECHFSEKKLANALSSFLWHFKGRLDHEFFQLLEHNFVMQFVVQKQEFPFLTSYLQGFIDQLKSNEGRVPFFPLEKTQYFLRDQLRIASALQRGGVTFKHSVLEAQLREEKSLKHGEYLPFVECLFLAWQKKALPLSDIEADRFYFEPMNIPEARAIAYDEQTKTLIIHDQVVKLARAAKQKNLAQVLAEEETLGKEWLYDEIIEDIDHDEPNMKRRKSYDNAAYQLKANIRTQAKIDDFIILTNNSVRINPQYLS